MTQIYQSILIFLCIALILFCFHRFNQMQERFLDYTDYITVPSFAYESMAGEGEGAKKYYMEFNDRFFLNALNKNADANMHIDVSSFEPTSLPKSKVQQLEESVSALLARVLNAELDSNDTQLFNTLNTRISTVKKNGDSYVVEAKSVVHRLNKAYGVTIDTTCLYTESKMHLLAYNLQGFVFEDKLYGDVLPSNLITIDDLIYENIMKEKIMQSKEYENKMVCKYLSDLKKFRNIDAQSLTDSNTNCDG